VNSIEKLIHEMPHEGPMLLENDRCDREDSCYRCRLAQALARESAAPAMRKREWKQMLAPGEVVPAAPYVAFCAEHDLPLKDGHCDKCRDADGNTFALDMHSYYLVLLAARSSEAAPAPYDAEQIIDDAFAERLADDRRIVAHLEAVPAGKCACPVHEWLARSSERDAPARSSQQCEVEAHASATERISGPTERLVTDEEFVAGIADEASVSCIDWSKDIERQRGLRWLAEQVRQHCQADRDAVRREALEEALREGAQRMADILCEYGERGEIDRPFIVACSEWQIRAAASPAGRAELRKDGSSTASDIANATFDD